jgi:hypothetical protein
MSASGPAKSDFGRKKRLKAMWQQGGSGGGNAMFSTLLLLLPPLEEMKSIRYWGLIENPWQRWQRWQQIRFEGEH